MRESFARRLEVEVRVLRDMVLPSVSSEAFSLLSNLVTSAAPPVIAKSVSGVTLVSSARPFSTHLPSVPSDERDMACGAPTR
jgi:hypothetical protein